MTVKSKFLVAVGAAAVTAFGTAGDDGMAASSTPDMVVAPGARVTAEARCAALAGREFADARVEKAEYIRAGTPLPPLNGDRTPEFCRVHTRISPVAGSDIRIELWLPTGWNGNLAGIGGGGFEGPLSGANVALRSIVGAGYAAVVTDAGHSPSPEPKWALRQPEKIIDYGHRATHLGAVVAKAAVAEFYSMPAKRSYFHGCSNGGRDALMLAQRYPGDYDAIAVGAPANDYTALMASFARIGQLSRITPGTDTLSPKLKLVHDAAVAKCDAIDGVRDGLIGNPAACRFDPGVLVCKAGSGTACLSKAEVGAVRAIYRGSYSRDGREVVPGLPVGSEYEWTSWLTSPNAAGPGMATGAFRNMVYDDPAWAPDSFDFDRGYQAARKKVGPAVDATDPDLRPFLARGGKLLIYHGWDDAAIPAPGTIRYVDAVRRTVGSKGAANIRLFLVPGMAHCLGGNGPSFFDQFAELDRWATSGVAPERIIVAKHDNLFKAMAGLPTTVIQTRPACAWPKTARYSGAGSTDDAANFVCR